MDVVMRSRSLCDLSMESPVAARRRLAASTISSMPRHAYRPCAETIPAFSRDLTKIARILSPEMHGPLYTCPLHALSSLSLLARSHPGCCTIDSLTPSDKCRAMHAIASALPIAKIRIDMKTLATLERAIVDFTIVWHLSERRYPIRLKKNNGANYSTEAFRSETAAPTRLPTSADWDVAALKGCVTWRNAHEHGNTGTWFSVSSHAPYRTPSRE